MTPDTLTGLRSHGLLLAALLSLAACQCSSGMGNTVVPPPPPPGPGDYHPPPEPPPIGSDANHPAVLYQDLVTAPVGAWVTLWGRGFGSVRGTSAVLIGDVGVSSYKRWTDRMIELQVPPRAHSGVIVVRTVAGDSPPVPFAVHAGNVYFVARNGDDDDDGRTEGSAFRSFRKATAAAQPGDVVYIRAGVWAEIHDYEAIWSFYEARSGTPDRPIAFVGYPGEDAILGNNVIERCFNFYRGDNARPLENIVIAKLKLRPGCLGVPFINVNGGRIVGNEVWGSAHECQDGVIGLANSSGCKILGNVIHDNGAMKQDHAIYVQGFGANRDVEIAWNSVENQRGGRAIQVYGHENGDVVERLSIHDNVLGEIDRDGILIGWTDADALHVTDVKIFNNVIVRAGRCEGHGIRIDNLTAQGVSIFHNTLVDNGMGDRPCAESQGEPSGQLGVENAVTAALRNNILLASGRARCIVNQARSARLRISHNLFFGGSCATSGDDAPLEGNPRFINAASRDYHLLPGSPAIDAGVVLEEGFLPDHDGVTRPQGVVSDVGAYEAGHTQ